MRKIFLIISLTAAIIPLSCGAFFFEDFFEESSSTQVINKINVSTNTGGNTAEGGEINEGEGKINVEIKNIINGESIEPVEIKLDGNKVEVRNQIEVRNQEETSVEKEIKIDDKVVYSNEPEQKISGFMEEIKNFFQSIFKFFK